MSEVQLTPHIFSIPAPTALDSVSTVLAALSFPGVFCLLDGAVITPQSYGVCCAASSAARVQFQCNPASRPYGSACGARWRRGGPSCQSDGMLSVGLLGRIGGVGLHVASADCGRDTGLYMRRSKGKLGCWTPIGVWKVPWGGGRYRLQTKRRHQAMEGYEIAFSNVGVIRTGLRCWAHVQSGLRSREQ